MRRGLYWTLIVPLYWALVVHVLRDASPVFVDGCGPMPSFYWGRHTPFPKFHEYYENRANLDLVFSIPYYVAGLVVTVLGCGIGPQIAKGVTKGVRLRFVISSAAALIMLLVLAVISDVGGLLDWWIGPRFLLMRSFSAYDVLVLAKTFLPASLLSGFVALGWNFVARQQLTRG